MVSDIVLGSSIKSVLGSIKSSESAVNESSLRISTGKRVNTAIDDPVNFFSAVRLNNRRSDLVRLLDGMGQNINVIKVAEQTLQQIGIILDLAENHVFDAQTELEATNSALPEAILADNPVGYFQLYDAETGVAQNLGNVAGIDGVYTTGSSAPGNPGVAAPLSSGDDVLYYGAGGLSLKLDGSQGQYVAVPNNPSINTPGPFPERTVELVFNTTTSGGRQVLWEEGGNVNNLSIYLDGNLLRVNGRTTFGPDYGPLDISIEIEEGETYHVAFTQDGPNDTFTGYLNGVSFGSESMNGTFIGNHPARNGIGAMNNDGYFHDGPQNGYNHYFTGEISDVAIYNSILSPEDIAARYDATSLGLSETLGLELNKILQQIDLLVDDANYKGINLLEDDTLQTNFNEFGSSRLVTEGVDLTLAGLGLDNIKLQRPSQVEGAIEAIQKAREEIRAFAGSLANDIYVINTRLDFTNRTISILDEGAADLIVADLNEEGATQLAAQTRLIVSQTALSLAADSQRTILNLFIT